MKDVEQFAKAVTEGGEAKIHGLERKVGETDAELAARVVAAKQPLVRPIYATAALEALKIVRRLYPWRVISHPAWARNVNARFDRKPGVARGKLQQQFPGVNLSAEAIRDMTV